MSSEAPLALLRFHALGAARVAQRNGLLLIGTTIVLMTARPERPLQLIRGLILSLAARDVPSIGTLFLTALAAALAAGAVPTLSAGSGGWLRSLALSQTQHRRALTVALLVPMLPVAAFELSAIALVPTVFAAPLSGAKIVALPLALLAAAMHATPCGIASRTLGFAAGWLASLGRWDAIVGAMMMMAAADRVAGPLVLAPRRARFFASHAIPVSQRIAIRALGWPTLATLLPALVLSGFAYLYRVNNEYTRAEAAGMLRGCALVGMMLLLAALADRLLVRRPPWPWARSLPVGSRRRVLDDAVVLATGTIAPLAIVVALDWRTALVVLAATPLLIVQASGAIRRGRGRMTRAGGEVIFVGVIVTLLVTLWPPSALLCVAAVPAALLSAVHSDRRLVGTAWIELHQSAVGDSLSTSR